MLPVELAQTFAEAVIVAETELLTERTTSSLAVPQPALLLVVSRKVTVPVPLTLTAVLALAGLTIAAEAEPVEPTTAQAGDASAPFDTEPLTLNAVVPPEAQSV